jgi:hypothetical protein
MKIFITVNRRPSSFRTPVGFFALCRASRQVSAPEKAITMKQRRYKFSENVFMDTNVFNTQINSPIVYTSNPDTGVGEYENFGVIATRGLEGQLKYKTTDFYLGGNYSYYTLTSTNISSYSVPNVPSITIGAPSHKANLFATYQFIPKFYLTPSIQF